MLHFEYFPFYPIFRINTLKIVPITCKTILKLCKIEFLIFFIEIYPYILAVLIHINKFDTLNQKISKAT